MRMNDLLAIHNSIQATQIALFVAIAVAAPFFQLAFVSFAGLLRREGHRGFAVGLTVGGVIINLWAVLMLISRMMPTH
jgi:hypothetical protein